MDDRYWVLAIFLIFVFAGLPLLVLFWRFVLMPMTRGAFGGEK